MFRKPSDSAACAMSTARRYISSDERAEGDCIRRKVPNLRVMSPSPRGTEEWMGLAGHPDAQAVDRGAGRQEERAEIRPAEGDIGRHFRSADDPEPRAVGRENPRAARSGAVHAPLDVDLHAVRHAIDLVG